MKKLTTGLLALMALCFIESVNAQTADEVVDKYVSAMGGKEKLASLKSVKKTGGLTVQGTDVGIVVTALNGVGSRTDISVMGQEGFQIFTPAKGWSFMPFMGQASPDSISADDLAASQQMTDLQGMLFNYKEKGSQVVLAGKENVEAAECYKLQLTNKAGKLYTFFVDAKTGYCVKLITKSKASGTEEDVVTNYFDFRKTDDGYVFPFSQTNARGTIVFSSIEVNKPVDEKIFTAN